MNEEAEKGFVKYNENVASSFSGEGPDGPMQLGSDILLYGRYIVFEQGAINRLAMSDSTIANELEDFVGKPGVLYLGNPEDIREYLHKQVDKIFVTIYGNRKMLGEDVVKKVLKDEVELDDILYPQEPEEGIDEE